MKGNAILSGIFFSCAIFNCNSLLLANAFDYGANRCVVLLRNTMLLPYKKFFKCRSIRSIGDGSTQYEKEFKESLLNFGKLAGDAAAPFNKFLIALFRMLHWMKKQMHLREKV